MLSNLAYLLRSKKIPSQILNTTSIRLNSTINFERSINSEGLTQEQIKEQREKKILREIISEKPRADECDPILGLKDTPFINRLKTHLQDINVLVGGFSIKDIENAILLQSIVKKEETEKKKILADEYSQELLKNSENTENIKEELEASKEEEAPKEVTPKTLNIMTEEFIEKKNALIKILTIKNADDKEKIRTAIAFTKKEFALNERDENSPQLNAGIATVRILFLTEYCKKNPSNKKNLKELNRRVQMRQKLLKNLKITNPEGYFFAITKIGLTDEAVHKEFHLSDQYMQQFKFFGPETQTYKQTRSEKRLVFKHRLLFARYPEYVKQLQKEYNVEDLDFIPKTTNAN
ncbi:hypothetical protein ACO0OE_001060 [Hanseniaspora uvarum]